MVGRPRRARRSADGPVVAGDVGAGPPVVLLHGLAGSARWWERNVPALARSFRVLAIDLPGFGRTARAARFLLEDVPAQLAAELDRLGIERAHVVGHSMGGLVAAGLAAEHPDRVDRLVLVDAGFVALDRGIKSRIAGPLTTLVHTSPTLLPVFLGDSLRSGPIRLAGATVQVLQADWRAKLPLVDAPTLVLWGEHDGICPPAIGREIVARIRGSHLVVIPGAAHSPMWERSADFDREVLAFLSAGQAGIAAATNGSMPPTA